MIVPIPTLPASFTSGVLALFHGSLSTGQGMGLRLLLAGTAGFNTDQRAYILATVCHETGRAMQPVAEDGRGAGHAYGPEYYGRGHVQLTWRYNYARFGALLGVDLVRSPDRALGWDVSLPVLTLGMRQGLFTGRKLADYFGPASYGDGCNPIDARRIVNGTDCAATIAEYFWTFRAALSGDPSETKSFARLGSTLRAGSRGATLPT